ncbi:glycosyl hydrolase [Balneola sp. MJW-20]|uniref:glycosyl hydrolase n=1 Tax=Gracilimonas aurantiaca TaxID=3234185 RepID=UPI003466D112
MNSYYVDALKWAFFWFFIVLLITPQVTEAQSVQVGSGSYSTSLPSGAVGPLNASRASISPKVSNDFSLPIQTNDFWSSLIFPFYGDPHSNVMYAHPLTFKAVSSGMQMGYTPQHVFAANDYLFPFQQQLTVGVVGLNASQTLPSSYGDWTVTAVWNDGQRNLQATFGHGLPFAYFFAEGGDALISTTSSPAIWYDQDGVLGLTVEGRHYGIFAPSGSVWTGTGSLRSTLNGSNYFSVALLPDNQVSTLQLFRTHAYAFVTNSVVSWNYDESTADLTTTYTLETDLQEAGNNNSSEAMTSLYRHQWLYADQPMTGYSYNSKAGTMRLYGGSEFSTSLKFSGVVPTLPDMGDYNRQQLTELVENVTNETLGSGPSYENGKAMGRFAHLIQIAEQMEAFEARDYFLSQLKNRLEDWLTAGGAQEYSYNDQWDVLTGYPSGYGADDQINDHHFHAGYAIYGAATVAQYDSAWASQENWGGMVNLLIKDANNWDRSDQRFPFLRSHDAYAGHSWAAGHGDFGDGNNQESSSESMNFATSVLLWGAASGQKEIRDLGIFLHANETTAIEQYWFDVDEQVFPEDYPHVAIAMVWGGKGVHSTWFGADPEFVHGINLLPITSGSLYLGRHPDHVIANYNEVVSERSGQPVIWKDVMWQYLALADPDRAIGYFLGDPNYERFDGESKAHTLHWLYNLKKMGRVDTTVHADTPMYSVFKNDAEERTYVAYNPESVPKTVTFTNGQTLEVPARSMATATEIFTDPEAPVAQIIADKTMGKAPLTIALEGSKSFDRNGGSLQYEWTFDEFGSSSNPDTSVVFTETGNFTIYLRVTNELQISATDSIEISVLGNGTPFNGAPKMIPGRIEAEHYDKGGEGVAYHDKEAANIGLAFRPDEGVDLEPSNDQGFDVYWITAGEWLEYTIEVPEAGNYDISPYVATVPGFGNFRLSINNVDVSGRRDVLHTGGWQNWKPITIENVELQPGVQILRMDFDSDTDKEGWLFSLNYIQVKKSVTVSNEGEDDLPSKVSLTQNYPNPFNPTTQITYSLPESAEVRLSVFNMLGQRVALLVNDRKTAGSHTVNFRADAFSSGVYFYVLQTGDIRLTKKMTLLK